MTFLTMPERILQLSELLSQIKSAESYVRGLVTKSLQALSPC